MNIDDFIWLSDIVEKLISKHNVTQEEAEEIFFNRPRFRFVERGFTKGEDVYSASGRTDFGRFMILVLYPKTGQFGIDY